MKWTGRRRFRNPARVQSATWSRIHIKSDWWQFEDGERLKTEEGWERFDHGGTPFEVF